VAGALLLAACLELAALDVVAGPSSTRALSPQVYQRLSEVQELMGQGEYAAAEQRLNRLLPELAPRGYEKAVGLQMLALTQGARQRYRQAAQSLAASVALEVLPEDAQQQARYDLAQLYLAADMPAQAVPVIETWFQQAEQPAAAAYFLLGTAYVQSKQYRKAISPLQRAIETAQSPDESWFQTLLATHYELADYQSCAKVLESMVRLFPERDYWQQLAGVYLLLHRDERALTVLELAHRQQRLQREQDLLQLAQLYLAQDIPFKAAQLLDTAMQSGAVAASADNLELLAGAWAQARERSKAIAAYQRALRAGAKAQLGLYLAELYIEDEHWEQAAATVETLLKRGGLSDPGDAWLLLGIARYESSAFDAARSAFNEAARYKDASAAARQWLEHLRQQL
jgi:tetratricopeptide (TPR) repeat protein